MTFGKIASTFAVLAALALAAPVAEAQDDGPPRCRPDAATGLYEYISTRIVYDNDILQGTTVITRQRVVDFVNRVTAGTPVAGEPVLSRVRTILRQPSLFPELYGTKGLYVEMLIRAARDVRQHTGASGFSPYVVRPFGRIEREVELVGANAPGEPVETVSGYALAPDMSGHIVNTMCFEIYSVDRTVSPPRVADHVVTYHYRVKLNVPPCGFRIMERDGTGNFPGSFLEGDLSGKPARFAFKLEATAIRQGSEVHHDGTTPCTPDLGEAGAFLYVDYIAVRQNDGAWIHRSRGDPRFSFLYALDSRSCLDIFFERRPPLGEDIAGGFDDPDATLDYCLGRCRLPLVVNTGL